MNQHQEYHHASQHQNHLENPTQTDIGNSGSSEANDRETVLDELEKMMFERAR